MGERRVDGRIEKGESTRAHIVATATRIFTEHGYAQTSIETLIDAAGVSRGALYHHFPGKDRVFAAVLTAVEERVLATVVGAAQRASTPLAALHAGCTAWLQLARDPEVRQIVLIDAPAVLGWEAWRALDERYAFGLLRDGLAAMARNGALPQQSVEPYAHIILASVIEFSLVVARDPEPATKLAACERAMRELIDRLLG
jgi:AcrR family transcriptional regulator